MGGMNEAYWLLPSAHPEMDAITQHPSEVGLYQLKGRPDVKVMAQKHGEDWLAYWHYTRMPYQGHPSFLMDWAFTERFERVSIDDV